MVREGLLREWGEGLKSGNCREIQTQEMSKESPLGSSQDESDTAEIRGEEQLACLGSPSHTATSSQGHFTL